MESPRSDPSFGRLLAASGLEEGDVSPRDTSPPRDAGPLFLADRTSSRRGLPAVAKARCHSPIRRSIPPISSSSRPIRGLVRKRDRRVDRVPAAGGMPDRPLQAHPSLDPAPPLRRVSRWKSDKAFSCSVPLQFVDAEPVASTIYNGGIFDDGGLGARENPGSYRRYLLPAGTAVPEGIGGTLDPLLKLSHPDREGLVPFLVVVAECLHRNSQRIADLGRHMISPRMGRLIILALRGRAAVRAAVSRMSCRRWLPSSTSPQTARPHVARLYSPGFQRSERTHASSGERPAIPIEGWRIGSCVPRTVPAVQCSGAGRTVALPRQGNAVLSKCHLTGRRTPRYPVRVILPLHAGGIPGRFRYRDRRPVLTRTRQARKATARGRCAGRRATTAGPAVYGVLGSVPAGAGRSAIPSRVSASTRSTTRSNASASPSPSRRRSR